MFPKSIKQLSLLFAVFVSISACVTNKKFEAQSQELAQAQSEIKSLKTAQEKSKNAVDALNDSIQALKTWAKTDYTDRHYSLYKNAVAAKDYNSAVVFLQQILSADQSQAYWIYDSLAYYHFLFLNDPNNLLQPSTTMYFVEQGLKIKPENLLLQEIKGSVLLQLQQDSASYSLFKDLWQKTGDYTFLWNNTFMDLYVYQDIKKVEKTIAEMVKNPDALVKTVRINQLEEHVIESVPAKAAFLYLRAVLQNGQGQPDKARKTLEEIVKIAPNFATAQRTLFQLKNKGR